MQVLSVGITAQLLERVVPSTAKTKSRTKIPELLRVAAVTGAAMDGGRRRRPVGHEPQHAGAAVAIPSSCFERAVREGEDSIPPIFPPRTATIWRTGGGVAV